MEDYEGFERWLQCICFVTFDLELGPKVESVCPPSALTLGQCSVVSKLAFPDSHINSLGDMGFCFRTHSTPAEDEEESCSVTSACAPPESAANATMLFGFVHFRQVKDASNPRGFFQKSIVLISRLPYIDLFQRIVMTFGAVYYSYGAPILDALVRDINGWPTPHSGLHQHLPFIGSVFNLHIHHLDPLTGFSIASSVPSLPQSLSRPASRLPSHDSHLDVDLFYTFKHQLHNLWLYWELVITGEPILVVGHDPQQCSQLVLGLLSLISPLPYCGDYRPYFSLYDPDFKHYQAVHDAGSLSAVILGVNNPFFLKAFEKFPHILCFQDSRLSTKPRSTMKVSKSMKSDMLSLTSRPSITMSQFKPSFHADPFVLKALRWGGSKETDTHTVVIHSSASPRGSPSPKASSPSNHILAPTSSSSLSSPQSPATSQLADSSSATNPSSLISSLTLASESNGDGMDSVSSSSSSSSGASFSCESSSTSDCLSPSDTHSNTIYISQPSISNGHERDGNCDCGISSSSESTSSSSGQICSCSVSSDSMSKSRSKRRSESDHTDNNEITSNSLASFSSFDPPTSDTKVNPDCSQSMSQSPSIPSSSIVLKAVVSYTSAAFSTTLTTTDSPFSSSSTSSSTSRNDSSSGSDSNHSRSPVPENQTRDSTSALRTKKHSLNRRSRRSRGDSLKNLHAGRSRGSRSNSVDQKDNSNVLSSGGNSGSANSNPCRSSSASASSSSNNVSNMSNDTWSGLASVGKPSRVSRRSKAGNMLRLLGSEAGKHFYPGNGDSEKKSPSGRSPESPSAAVSELSADDAAANATILRSAMSQITMLFLEPFLSFFAVPEYEEGWNPYLVNPKLPLFAEATFLAAARKPPKGSLDVAAYLPLEGQTIATRRTRLVALYSRFLTSPHFGVWFTHSRNQAQAGLDKMVLDRIVSLEHSAFLMLLQGLRLSQCREMLSKARLILEHYQSTQVPIDLLVVSTLDNHIRIMGGIVARNEGPRTSPSSAPGQNLALSIREDHF